MRLLALLLSLYLTCLACLPCADDVATCAAPAQTSVSPASHSEGGQHDLGDWCSPLCQCHCCAGAVLAPGRVVPLALLAPLQWVAGPSHAALLVAAPTRSTAAVWQPPRA
ncbi:DUF6660 family protein [Hymenobacter ruricola]|uniref:DUF2946 domain-containing protein n=1 Tax=Hymenobacter ruricola TaxID=2791023 RepID=A0ABS0HXT6_9BACT|nr:DUF6660 family protein [Hymenobacter ruricola]MBF9219472.1 hypothetical protein [Hymenobacter ruricola]